MAVIKLIVDGGAMKPGPTIAQQLGPKGINIGKVIEDINKMTVGFKGVKVPVELDVNEKTKGYEIKVFSPPVAELLKKELGLEKGSGEAGKTKVANAAIEQIISIAKTKLVNMLARDLKNAVKLVLGSCVSLGILVENKSPIEVQNAQTILWNGPVGISEIHACGFGSRFIARMVATRAKGRAFGVAGGGDTLPLIVETKTLPWFDHVSTGGGALLEFVTKGGDLPGLKPLRLK
jgi:large subunit ribosomal protein L11